MVKAMHIILHSDDDGNDNGDCDVDDDGDDDDGDDGDEGNAYNMHIASLVGGVWIRKPLDSFVTPCNSLFILAAGNRVNSTSLR